MVKKQLAILGLTTLCLSQAYANLPTAISGSFGTHGKNKVIGGRLAVQIRPNVLNWGLFSMYFHAAFSYWHTKIASNSHLFAFSVGPELRLHITRDNSFNPYIYGSIAPSYVSHTVHGNRNIGSHFQFEDIVGIGASFGSKQQYNLSVAYLHYSHASLASKYNAGVDVLPLVTFSYLLNPNQK